MQHPSQGVTSRHDPIVCPTCERRVPRKARQQTYCSSKCQRKAVRALKIGGRYRPSGQRRNPPKKLHETNGLQASKWGPSLDIKAPRHVIEAEVFGRHRWTQSISSAGVSIELGKLVHSGLHR